MNLRKCTVIVTIFVCVVLFPLFASAQENETNHCNDPESWVKWQELLQSNPDDDGIYSAYALRVGLCQMIEKHEIETGRATIIFEHYMESLIATKKALKEQEEPNADGKI
ncbi:MAG: hypothetical protein V1706_08535 [Pseudomonadota bacterium]